MMLFIVIIAIVTSLLSYQPLCDMTEKLEDFCHKLKYLFMILSSGLVVYLAFSMPTYRWAFLLLEITLFLVAWPRVIWWLENQGYIKK